ncbi:MAG: nicotinamide riboside transporter PnuC [Paludibacteraceae bacterium]
MTITIFFDYFQKNWIELSGTILSLVYLYFSIKENVLLWIFGFLCSALYIVVFFDSKFYADMSLQVYYLAVSVYGWISWHKKDNRDTSPLHITKLNRRELQNLSLYLIAIYFVYFVVLRFFTDSPIPIMDSLVGALSVIGTWLLAKKKIENWILWIVADALAAGLFAYKKLYPTSILFIIYTTMAIVGYLRWKATMRART